MTEDQKEEVRDVVRALLVEEILPQVRRAIEAGTIRRPRDTMAIIAGVPFGREAAEKGARAGAEFAVDSRRAECVETRRFAADEIFVPGESDAKFDARAREGLRRQGVPEDEIEAQQARVDAARLRLAARSRSGGDAVTASPK